MLLALVLVIAVIFWMKSGQDLDVYTNPDFNKSSLSGGTTTWADEKPAPKVWEPVAWAKMLFGVTGQCEQMFAEYYATYDTPMFATAEAEHPFGTASIATENWFDGAWTVSLVSDFTDPYGYSFPVFTSGDAKWLWYASGDSKWPLATLRNISKDPTYTDTTETGFDQVQMSWFTEKFRPLVGAKAIPCLMKFTTPACDHLYVGMIRYPDRTMHDVECYTKAANGDIYLISSVDALNTFNLDEPQDDFSKNYVIWNKAIVWFVNHLKKN